MIRTLSTPPVILFVDDDADVQQAAALLLPRQGFVLRAARTPEEAWSVLAAQAVDAVLLDLNFQRNATTGAEGLRLLGEIVAYNADISVVVVTGYSGVAVAVAAMRAGAVDFVMKPWRNDQLVATLHEAAALGRQRRDAKAGTTDAGAASPDDPFIGESHQMRRVLDLLRRAASTDAAILLLGEAGTGKTLLSQMAHRWSRRSGKRLTTIEPTSVWAQGEPARAGTLNQADDDGTLYLDEIGAMPRQVQAWLAGALARQPHMRLISSSRLPRSLLHDGRIHADLLVRLNTIEIAIPSLHERGDDRIRLAHHFLRLFAERYGRRLAALSPAAEAWITSAAWDGNVRELRQAIERAVVLMQGDVITPGDLSGAEGAAANGGERLEDGSLTLATNEKAVIESALKRHAFNVSHTAGELGVSRAALYRRMARYGL